MKARRFAGRFALGLALAVSPMVFATGCSSDDTPSSQSENVKQKSNFTTDFDAYNAIYNTQFETLEQVYSVLVTVGDKTIPAPTHLIGDEVNIIAYSNDDNVKAADGTVFKRGDSEIAKVYKQGQLGIAVKHHRSEFPTLDLNNADPTTMKEHFKLQDTHIEIVVGVERDGEAGAITVNNPQGYEDGGFGDKKYAMMFLKPSYPEYLSDKQVEDFENNIRTMLLAFNAVTNFPGDYNGGDPLGARDHARVGEHVKNMINALNGDAEAQAYFQDPENQVYCAELAFIAFTAGAMYPLNERTIVNELGVSAEAFANFRGFLEAHNAGERSPLTEMNDNDRVKYVTDLTLAPEDLQAMGSYGPAGEAEKLGFQPMTMADIIEQFMRTHLPREILGEALAPAQAAVLTQMKPGLLETMGLDQVPETDPSRVAVDALFAQLVQVIGTEYESYAAFRAALEPVLAQARAVTGPRGDTGEGLFIPPSAYHVIAQGKLKGGLFGLDYMGHGVHVSAVKSTSAPAPEPTDSDDIAIDVSCGFSLEGTVNACGGQAPGGCWCDATCDQYGDCCADVAAVCR